MKCHRNICGYGSFAVFFCVWLNWHSRLSKNNSANFMWHLLLVAPSLIQFKVVSELNMFWLKSKSQLLKEKEEFSQLEKVQTISIQQFPNNFGHFCFWLSETYKWPQSLFCWKTQPKSNPRHLIRMIMIPNQPTKRPWQRQIRDHLENKNKSLGVKLTFFKGLTKVRWEHNKKLNGWLKFWWHGGSKKLRKCILKYFATCFSLPLAI